MPLGHTRKNKRTAPKTGDTRDQLIEALTDSLKARGIPMRPRPSKPKEKSK